MVGLIKSLQVFYGLCLEFMSSLEFAVRIAWKVCLNFDSKEGCFWLIVGELLIIPLVYRQQESVKIVWHFLTNQHVFIIWIVQSWNKELVVVTTFFTWNYRG